MTHVRDVAIGSCDRLVQGSGGGPLGARWRDLLASSGAHDAAMALIPDIVDQTLFHLVDAIDNGTLPLAWSGEAGVELLQDAGFGEMAGSLAMGRGGWIEKYSSERHFDPLSGLP